jgi:hypothetical protein
MYRFDDPEPGLGKGGHIVSTLPTPLRIENVLFRHHVFHYSQFPRRRRRDHLMFNRFVYLCCEFLLKKNKVPLLFQREKDMIRCTFCKDACLIKICFLGAIIRFPFFGFAAALRACLVLDALLWRPLVFP